MDIDCITTDSGACECYVISRKFIYLNTYLYQQQIIEN